MVFILYIWYYIFYLLRTPIYEVLKVSIGSFLELLFKGFKILEREKKYFRKEREVERKGTVGDHRLRVLERLQ